MIKLIATDMDHTLLNDLSQLPSNFGEAVECASQKNVAIVLASGRTMFSIKNKAAQYADQLYFVSDNGAIVEHNNTIIYQSVMTSEDIQAILSVLREGTETTIIASSASNAYAEIFSDLHAKYLEEYYPGFIPVQDINTVSDTIVKITTLSLDNTVKNFNEIVQPGLSEHYNAVTSGKIWIDIMHTNVNKGNGLKMLLNELNISPQDIMTFGDYHNDIEMLELTNHSYAVHNAHPDVKLVAKNIIGSNNDESVTNTIIDKLNY